MGIDCSVNASKFLIQENISSVSYSPGEPQIIGLLEFLEGPHQYGMRHRRVGQNAPPLGLKFILGINIQYVSPSVTDSFLPRASTATSRAPRCGRIVEAIAEVG